jgi:hypothetical protein
MSVRVVFGALMVLGLSACSTSQQELNEWMEQQQREVKPSVTPLSRPQKIQPPGLPVWWWGRALQHAKAHGSHQTRSSPSELFVNR